MMRVFSTGLLYTAPLEDPLLGLSRTSAAGGSPLRRALGLRQAVLSILALVTQSTLILHGHSATTLRPYWGLFLW
jgi:hypothetical protein